MNQLFEQLTMPLGKNEKSVRGTPKILLVDGFSNSGLMALIDRLRGLLGRIFFVANLLYYHQLSTIMIYNVLT